jgi:CheY-like chemotaxis protein
VVTVHDLHEQTRYVSSGKNGAPDDAGRNAFQPLSDRVLLVEDNPVNQRVTIAMLDQLGFCTDVVDNGVEAVIAATMVPYRAILMDCQIPALNGFEATIEIRSQWGASRGSPIIAVSSSSSEPDKARCLAAGMDGHLTKPLTLESLAAGMARWAPDPSDMVGVTDKISVDSEMLDEPRPSPGTPPPALDAKVIGRLVRLAKAAGEDLLGELSIVFLIDADDRVQAMHEALVREDGPALIQSAHTLCGASANLGATELARLCARLATDGAVGNLHDGETLLRSVKTELERVRLALGGQTPAPLLTLVPATASPTASSTPTPLP